MTDAKALVTRLRAYALGVNIDLADQLTFAADLIEQQAAEIAALREMDTTWRAAQKACKDCAPDVIAKLEAEIAALRAGAARASTVNPWGRDDLMASAAVRYCLGRSTYIVGDRADWLICGACGTCWRVPRIAAATPAPPAPPAQPRGDA